MAKRLIYADEIENLFYAQVENGATDLMDAFDAALQDAQTVDAVEVVRCENCERSKLDGFYCCGADMMPPHPTFPHCFCSYGERGDGGQAPQREDKK